MNRCLVHTMIMLGAVIAAASAAAKPVDGQAMICPDFDPNCDYPPSIGFSPWDTTVTDSILSVKVDFSDDYGLVLATRSLSTSSGTTILSQQHTSSGATSASSDLVLRLQTGTNVLTAYICDNNPSGPGCTQESAVYTYNPPPPPPQRGAAILSAAPQDGTNRNLIGCDDCVDAILTYSTPGYVSLDQERSVTLLYASGQTRPRGLVQIDARDPSVQPAARLSLQLLYPNGAPVQFVNGSTELHFANGPGTSRLAGQFDASTLATGSYRFTAVVRSWWSDGTMHQASVPVRVLILNERNSHYGLGWSLVGEPRVHRWWDAGDAGALVTRGDGSGVYFSRPGSCNLPCTYLSPIGDYSTLVEHSNRYEQTFPDGSRMVVFTSGASSYVEDRHGNRVTFTYQSGRLASIQDPAGLTIQLGYGGNGKLSTLTGPGQRTSTLIYSGSLVTQINDPDGVAALKPRYDANQRLTHWFDRIGSQWDVTYDAPHQTLSSVLAPAVSEFGSTIRPETQYRSVARAVLPPAGTGSSVSPAPRVLPDSATLRVTTPKGAVTRIRGDRFGQAVWAAGPDGRVTTIERDARGHVIHAHDGTGTPQWFEYGAGDWRVTRVRAHTPDGPIVRNFTYTTFGLVSTVQTGSQGPTTHYAYDTAGNLLNVRVDADTLAQFTYDARGRVLTHRDNQGSLTSVTYQTSGFLNTHRVTAPGNRQTTFAYDGYGRRNQVTAPDGRSAGTVFDLVNRPTTSTDFAGQQTSYFYANGRDLYRVQDARSQNYYFHRDALGRVTSTVDPLARTTSYGYDRAGNVTSRTNRRGQTVSSTYDHLNRLVTRTADGQTTTYAYHPNHEWVAASNTVSTDTIFFDEEGKTRQVKTNRSGVGLRLDSYYDSHRRRTVLTHAGPWGVRSMTWGFDARSRLKEITDFAGSSTTFTHRDDGAVSTVRLPMGLTLGLGYTPHHEISSLTFSGSGAAGANDALARFYEYNSLGQVRERETGGSDVVRRYRYDTNRRVSGFDDVEVTQEWFCWRWPPQDDHDCWWMTNETTVATDSYTYDAVGNPTDRNAVTGTGNRLTSFDGWSLQYDLDGNLTRKVKGSVDRTLSWNALGQLTSVATAGVGTTSYAYDGFGRRVRRTAPNGSVTQYVYDGHNLLLEFSGTGILLREYSHYPGIDAPHAVRQWEGGAGGQTFYYLSEVPGHVSGLVNASGTVVNRYRYAPFGTAEQVVEATYNPLRYMARELDPVTGMYYVRNRWYDADLRRFISEDPIGLEGGINLYAYAFNDPVNLRDPMGLTPGCVSIGICVLEEVVVVGNRPAWWSGAWWRSDPWSTVRGWHSSMGEHAMGWGPSSGDERKLRETLPSSLEELADEPGWDDCMGDAALVGEAFAATLVGGAGVLVGKSLERAGGSAVKMGTRQINRFFRNKRPDSFWIVDGITMINNGRGAVAVGAKVKTFGGIVLGLGAGYLAGAALMCGLDSTYYQ